MTGVLNCVPNIKVGLTGTKRIPRKVEIGDIRFMTLEDGRSGLARERSPLSRPKVMDIYTTLSPQWSYVQRRTARGKCGSRGFLSLAESESDRPCVQATEIGIRTR